MTKPQIHIIGLGVIEKAALSAPALKALQQSTCIIGSDRQLAVISELLSTQNNAIELLTLPKLGELKSTIQNNKANCISILASGDPLHYGIGRWFTRHFNHQQLYFYPAVSSIQAACHKLALSLQDITVLSLHGRPLEKLRSQLKNHSTAIVLTDKYSHPRALAQECLAAGFEQSTLTVCENMGYAQETLRTLTAQQLTDNDNTEFDPLHVTVINVVGKGGVLPEFPGFPDSHFETGELSFSGKKTGKGMISKREVRLAILSFLQPTNDDIIWDIGAGCGGVAVELAYWNERVSVHAIEMNPQRLACLKANRLHFGVSHNLHIIQGHAPECLDTLPPANKIFIGGSDGELTGLLQKQWQQLPKGGLLVASAVMAATKQQLKDFAETLHATEVESVEIGVKRSELINGKLHYNTKLPVEIFKFTK